MEEVRSDGQVARSAAHFEDHCQQCPDLFWLISNCRVEIFIQSGRFHHELIDIPVQGQNGLT